MPTINASDEVYNKNNVNKITNDVALSGASFGTSYANIDTTYMKADLPEKGTYMVYVNATFLSVGSQVCYVRLYNNTLSAEVPKSFRYAVKNDGAPGGYATEVAAGLLWQVTVTGPTVMYLQGKCGSDTNAGLRANANVVGYEMGYFKVTI